MLFLSWVRKRTRLRPSHYLILLIAVCNFVNVWLGTRVLTTLSPIEKGRLALLYPPGLVGGYRNQVIRFTALVDYAQKNNLDLFLPSLLWTTQIGNSSLPIPMEHVFDVDYWNTFDDLPKIVADLKGSSSDCWIPYNKSHLELQPLRRASFQRGILGPMVDEYSKFRRQRVDWLPRVQHCQNPVVYGGGTQVGRLWKDTMRSQNETLQRLVTRALRPAPRWRRWGRQCLDGNYTAVHARVEVDMMTHKCGQGQEWNLTRILAPLVAQNNQTVLVALNRKGLESYRKYAAEFEAYRVHNLNFLDTVDKRRVHECGERWTRKYFEENPTVPDHGTLLASVLNFELAVDAYQFVGVAGSSYSSSIWRMRYWKYGGNNAARNYRYARNGTLIPVEGLLPAHTSCRHPLK